MEWEILARKENNCITKFENVMMYGSTALRSTY
jgi:hypothetical protein